MKLTNKQLRQIIKEELEAVMNEANPNFNMSAYQNTPAPTTRRMGQAGYIDMDANKVTISNIPSPGEKIEIDTLKLNKNVLRAIRTRDNKELGEEIAKAFAFGIDSLKPHVDSLSKAQVSVDKEMVIMDDETMDDKFKDSKKINRGSQITQNMPNYGK
jgi:hypothetical protein